MTPSLAQPRPHAATGAGVSVTPGSFLPWPARHFFFRRTNAPRTPPHSCADIHGPSVSTCQEGDLDSPKPRDHWGAAKTAAKPITAGKACHTQRHVCTEGRSVTREPTFTATDHDVSRTDTVTRLLGTRHDRGPRSRHAAEWTAGEHVYKTPSLIGRHGTLPWIPSELGPSPGVSVSNMCSTGD